MNFMEVFEEIVSITHHDYAGWDEKKGWDNPEFYMNKVIDLESNDPSNALEFKEIVDDYLLAFQDRHMYFTNTSTQENNNKTIGFRARRFQNTLYIIQTTEERRFSIGTKIITIDGKTIEDISKLEKNIFTENNPERQKWESILNRATIMEILNEFDETEKFNVHKYDPLHHVSSYSFENINDDTLLLTFSDFEDINEIVSTIDNLSLQLANNPNLIIDIRQNYGGNANSISALLPFIFSEGEKPSSEIKKREFNCTERNSDLFIKLCIDSRQVITDEKTLHMLDFAESQFKMHKGQGFVSFDFSAYIEELEKEFHGKDCPKQVVLLTDSYTASAAEEFTEVCKQSSKVKVIGRSTMGINDYSDLVVVTWNDEYSLYYPISKLEDSTESHEIHGIGIKPDIYIPWTPEHLGKDIDLITALNLMDALSH